MSRALTLLSDLIVVSFLTIVIEVVLRDEDDIDSENYSDSIK